jgi:hypothetical protein
MRDHEKLKVFELADRLAIRIYRSTANFPPAERYGLGSDQASGGLHTGKHRGRMCPDDAGRVFEVH